MEFLKPTKNKIILTAIPTLLHLARIYFLNLIPMMCKLCPPEQICKSSWPKLYPSCVCCYTTKHFLFQMAEFLIPIMIFYIIACFIEKKWGNLF